MGRSVRRGRGDRRRRLPGGAKGGAVTGVAAAETLEGVSVLHAGTGTGPDGGLVAAGGRVLAVVGLGEDLAAARARAYAGVAEIALEGSQHRGDIGLTAERGEITVPGTDGQVR